MTSLVFDHSLRIRLKAETAEKKAEEATPAASPSGSDTKGSNTPDNASERGDEEDDAGAETETETVHSRTTTGGSTATASTAVAPAPAKGKDDSKKAEAAKDVGKEAEKKGKNLVGKINNLVTSDLDNIVSGRDFLFISEVVATITSVRWC